MAPENSTVQITSGSRGIKVMAIIFMTTYIVFAGTVGFLLYERVVGVDTNYPKTSHESMRSNGDKNENITGTVFIRWGRNSCPKNDTGEITLVYSGYTASSSINRDGGSIVCLPQDPQWNRYDNKTLASTTGWLGVEYYGDELFDNVHRDNDAPCAVCYVALRSTMILIPGRKTCYPGWTTEYSGYQMSVIGTHTICIDEEPEGIAGGEARGNYMKRMFFTKIRCGTNTLCPPYVEERQLTCVVCTK